MNYAARISAVLFALILAILLPHSVNACTQAAPCTASDRIITFYVPHNAPGCRTSMEGCVETSRPGLDGQRVPRSLDDVRSGRSKYVTLASDSSNYGKYFNLGTITYTSALDRQKHTVQNVIGYVHDTGGAFRGRPQKLDVNTTICSSCTDAQASALASGKNVSFIPSNQGLVDPAGTGNTGYGNVLTGNSQYGAGTAPTGVQSGSAAPAGAPQSPQQPGKGQQPGETRPTGVTDTKNSKDSFVPEDVNGEEEASKKLSLICSKTSIQWSCGVGATSARGRSKPLSRVLNGVVATRGEIQVAPAARSIYTIECYIQNKKVEFASCTVPRAVKNIVNRPQLKLEVNTDSVRRGGHVHVTWSAYKVKQCIVSGQGISEKGPVGSVDTESLLIRGRSRIQLRCKALDGSEVHLEKEVYVE
jgi:hypothetical protein